MIEVLVCDCKDCTHWEIVKCINDKVHLLCKTCGRTDEVEITFPSDHPAHWEFRGAE